MSRKSHQLKAGKILDYYGILRIGSNFVPIYGTIKRCPVGGETYTEDVDVCKIHGVKLIDAMDIVNAIRDIATEVDQVMIGTDLMPRARRLLGMFT
ncbi:hypothetical protein [Vulcanisaeta sp. JCM 16161]|uniref:hypothetical protein n=1 Tax=Vulcanisaeta sp. JCM 16161 TaxID=1295372 RepID=UPI001FB27640|nr:hypothetical protein [Vulcanisaeta sp. JCM 16161]